MVLIFAAQGVNLFGGIEFDTPSNFDNLGEGIKTLMMITTGGPWSPILVEIFLSSENGAT
jgi:hypothetical protein